MTAYPTWVCHDCGMKYAHKPISRIGMATYHSGTCGVCKKQTDVTEPADFGYPNFEIERKKNE